MTTVSTPSDASTNNEVPASGVLGRMARRLFSRASSTPACDDVAVPSTSEFGPESSAVVASPSGEAPSGVSEGASGFSSPSVSQSLVSLNSQSILQDAQVVVTDSMDVEAVPVCDVTPGQCNSGTSSAINNVISTTENDSNVVESNKSTESNESSVSNVINVSNQSNELIESNVSNVVDESNDLIETNETNVNTASDNSVGGGGQLLDPGPIDAESMDSLEESEISPADVSELRKEKRDKERRKLLPSLRKKASSGVSKPKTPGRHVLPVVVSDRPPSRR